MLKKTVKYTDFNGEEVQEDFLFHLSKAELIELEASHEGGLLEAMNRIVEANDTKAIIAEFKRIILLSYGVKSGDGRRFIKNQKLRDDFESSEAYSTLFMELVTETEAAVEFMNGIIPQDMVPQNAEVTPIKPAIEESRPLTRKEAEEMPAYELMQKILSHEVVIVDE